MTSKCRIVRMTAIVSAEKPHERQNNSLLQCEEVLV
jgi:hypothetical protein